MVAAVRQQIGFTIANGLESSSKKNDRVTERQRGRCERNCVRSTTLITALCGWKEREDLNMKKKIRLTFIPQQRSEIRIYHDSSISARTFYPEIPSPKQHCEDCDSSGLCMNWEIDPFPENVSDVKEQSFCSYQLQKVDLRALSPESKKKAKTNSRYKFGYQQMSALNMEKINCLLVIHVGFCL